jgi:murein L,D-transpeptidase YcbB/YkuD
VIATGRTIELVPPRPVRVVLAYLTAWPSPDGGLALLPDPYRLDLPMGGGNGGAACRPGAGSGW